MIPDNKSILHRDTLNELVDLLAPHAQTESARQALLTVAFPGSPVLYDITYSGPTHTFVVGMITQLARYGQVEGKQAIWVLLEIIREQVGVNQQQRIDALHDTINIPGKLIVAGEHNLKLIYGSDTPHIAGYLNDILEKYGGLRERYIDLAGSAPPPRDPDNPFEDMFLVTPVMRMEGESEPVPSVQAALDAHDRLVMLGAPGAGKTTSLRMLLANAAERHLADPENHPLPLLLELGAWPDAAPDLESCIARHLRIALPMGSKLLLLLDGLNEMGEKYREQRIESIRQYLREFPLARVIVTCREHDYVKERDLDLPRLQVFELNDAQIQRLIGAYLPKVAAKTLWSAIQPESEWDERDKERSLLELARNPYLLALLTRIYYQNGSLPESQAKIFEQLVDLRYQHEAQRAKPSFDFETFTRMLGDLAFAMIDENKGTSVGKTWVERIGPRTDELLRFGEACSMLIVDGENVRFIHQLMQEYFAARALDWRGDIMSMAYRASEWHEILLVRAGMSKEATEWVVETFITALSWWSSDFIAIALGKIGTPAARATHKLLTVLSIPSPN